MRNIRYSLLVMFFATFSCKNKQTNLLVGKWQNYKTELRDGREKNSSDEKFISFLQWEFTQEYYISFKGEKVPYVLKENKIYFNGRPVYDVEKLTNEELVVIEINEMNGPTKYDMREYFKRVKKFE